MFALANGALVLSATYLTNRLAWEHLTQQRLGVARGERTRPRPATDPHADLVRERGQRHEDEQLARLRRCPLLATACRPAPMTDLLRRGVATTTTRKEGVK